MRSLKDSLLASLPRTADAVGIARRGAERSTRDERTHRVAFVVATVLVVGAVGSWARAQSLGAMPPAAPEMLLAGMRARVTVSMDKTGRTIPAWHCRHAPGGCDQRLGAFAKYLVSAAEKHSIDPWLMAAMAFKESGFNPYAIGSLGEIGILQINPERRDARSVRFVRDKWYRQRCKKEPGACQQEIVNHAAQVLARSLELCGGDVLDALGAYNTGRCGGNDRYAKRVIGERDQLRRAAGLQPDQISALANFKGRRPRS